MLERSLTLAVMESCTGGLLAHTVSNLPGCGQFFLGGIVAYDTATKKKFGVPDDVIARAGVFSGETAECMARAVRTAITADLAIGITGVAGPMAKDGERVGRVYLAAFGLDRVAHRTLDLAGMGPEQVKQRAVDESLDLLLELLQGATVDPKPADGR
jgi:nicotinamide-nucleotide amidase